MAGLFPQLAQGNGARDEDRPMRLGGPALLSGSIKPPPDWAAPRRYPVPPFNPKGGAMRRVPPSIPGADGDDILAGEQQITRDWLDERERREQTVPRGHR
jgi:hypothetical protein